MALETIIKNQKVRVGDTILVYQKIVEEGKTRTQPFEGVVISIKGSDAGKSFTVRKIASGGIGIERIWPVLSPAITRIVNIKQGKVRRSKLYYLRQRSGKRATKVKTAERISKKTQDGEQASSEQKTTRKKRGRSSPQIS